MKNSSTLLCLFTLLLSTSFGQNYDSYRVGNPVSINTTTNKGICLMGGATESDDAIKWFLQRANGGDILVLRASGADGYNSYMYSGLGITVNSVESIVCNDATASNELYIQQRIEEAEAIWFAGGDQWNYISYWRNTKIDSLINVAINTRNIVIGGTSAGMAILGEQYFSAQNGSTTSASALANPYGSNVTPDTAKFLVNNYLQDVITDTHYDNPDRRGRQTVFLARLLKDYGINARGIACDEYTAVCVNELGIARVYGDFPTYDDNAYFIQTNCELTSVLPENCTPGNPLEWNLGNQAIKVYQIKGDVMGTNTFDLNDWQTGNGGIWQDWYVTNGTLQTGAGNSPNCINGITESNDFINFKIFPNPVNDVLYFDYNFSINATIKYELYNSVGEIILLSGNLDHSVNSIDVRNLTQGFYVLKLVDENSNLTVSKKIIIE